MVLPKEARQSKGQDWFATFFFNLMFLHAFDTLVMGST